MVTTDGFAGWVRDFEAEGERRRTDGDPDWAAGARLPRAVVRSVQRFQVGEAGDGAHLIAAADRAGDPQYSAAVRLFVAEEQNHARLLASLLAAAGAPTIDSHWSDTVFVRLRRAAGLRVELVVLMVAEVVALRYYRALCDGAGDPLTAQVAGRILADEQRHVPFGCQRLRAGFASTPRAGRAVTAVAWRVLLLGAATIVGVGHGPALRRLGVGRREFVVDVARLFGPVVTDVLGDHGREVPTRAIGSDRPAGSDAGLIGAG